MFENALDLYSKFKADNALKIEGNQFAENSILCIGRNLFDKDIRQLSNHIRGFKWITLDNSYFGKVFSSYIPDEFQQQTFHREFPGSENCWAACTSFARDLLLFLMRKHHVVACMDSNIDYWQSYAVQLACKEIGLPFFVVSKENPVTQIAREYYLERYQGYEFRGTALACPSQHLKEVLLRTETLQENQAWITGYPRLDIYRTVNFNNSVGNGVLLLTFLSGNYGVADQEEYWNLIASLGKSSERKLFVKCKTRSDREIHKKKLLNSGTSAPITISRGAEISDLISQSRVAIGMNSQALLEPIIGGLPIIIPEFLADKKSGSMFFEGYTDKALESLNIFRVHKAREVHELLNALSGMSLDENARQEMLEKRDALTNTVTNFSRVKTASSKIGEMIHEYID